MGQIADRFGASPEQLIVRSEFPGKNAEPAN
jgi:hypothetical protein